MARSIRYTLLQYDARIGAQGPGGGGAYLRHQKRDDISHDEYAT